MLCNLTQYVTRRLYLRDAGIQIIDNLALRFFQLF